MRRKFLLLCVASFVGILGVESMVTGTVTSSQFFGKRNSVRVAFLELTRSDGTLVRFTPGGRFAHSAISYGDGWLHAYPYYGVQKISTEELEKIGRMAVVIDLPHNLPISDEAVRRYFGKPFDMNYSWDDKEIYCAELIAKLLGIAPEPMKFDPHLWPARYQEMNGKPGMSPDRLHDLLTSE